MNIVVCLKQILDPEIPARDFRVDAAKLLAEQGSANLVTNIFCENALETALQLREYTGAGKITVLSYGPPSAEDSLRKALAMKADAAALVVNEGDPKPDPLAVAQVLAAAIRTLEAMDLIMVGRESGDWGTGQTGGLLAEELDLPCVSFVDHIEATNGKLLLKRQTDAGWEVFEATPPIVVTITNDEYNVPRIPKVRDLMTSYRQQIRTWKLERIQMNDVVISFFSSGFDKATQGLAGEGRRLADNIGGRLHAVVLGEASDLAAALVRIADTVTLADQPELANYQPETYLAVLTQICRDSSPHAVLLGNDTYSQELAPRLAHRLGGSAVGDVIEVRAVDGMLFVGRQVYGGKAQAVIELKRRPAVVWLRARSFTPTPERNSQAEVTHSTLAIQPDTRTRMIECKREWK